jgi:hypothetical protein
MSNNPGRRTLLRTVGLVAVGGPILLTQRYASAAVAWTPDIARDGVRIFEGLEEDRGNVHPVSHIYKQGDAIRFDIHPQDRDSTGGGDRQRSESKGMRQGGALLDMENGQTWRIRYDLFIPSSLQATRGFTHIMQLKKPGPGGAPFMVMSLRDSGGQKIEVKFAEDNIMVGQVPLGPLHNKWITTEFEFRIAGGSGGRIRWKLSEAGRTLIDRTASGGKLFAGDRTRPKWGIYKKLERLSNAHLLMRNISGSGS